MPTSFPPTYKAVLLHSFGQPFTIESIPTPQPVHGTVIVKVESAPIYGPWKQTWANPSSSYPTPFVPGGQAIGRIAAVGPDTCTLEVGQLVLTEYFIRARDDPNGTQFLRATSIFGNPHALKLVTGDVHRHGSLAEYQIVAHENCHPLDEQLFLGSPSSGGLGYKLPQFGMLIWHAITYSALRAIDLNAGESIDILPATGVFGSCAVEVASAMGARVIAGGRNVDALRRLEEGVGNVKTFKLTGDIGADTESITKIYGGPVDTYLDISHPSMPNTKHISAGLTSLATYGRAAFMGFAGGDIPINYGLCVLKSLTIKGRLMYERNVLQSLIKLAGTGALKLDRIEVTEFKLEDWEEAIDVTEKSHGWRKLVSISP